MECDFSGFESQFDEEVPNFDDVIDVTTLTWQEVMELSEEVSQKLIKEGQALVPREQWARDAQSLREACRVDLQRRIVEQNERGA